MRKDSKAQIRYSGKVMRHQYWCGVLTLLLLIMTAIVLYLDTSAGCVVGAFTVVVYLTFLGLEHYYRPKVLQELLDFVNKYNSVEREMLREFAIPYGIAQPDGRMLWMNDMMADLVKKNADYHKGIHSVFPQITAAHFPKDVEDRSVEIDVEDRKYRVILRRILLDDLMEDLEGVEKITDESYVIGIHMFDITELCQLKVENYEQKAVVGLLYMDNYDEAMESVEDIRRSMLDALVDRRIAKYITSMGGLIRKLEKDKYLVVVNRKGLAMMEEDRFSLLEDVKTVNIGNSIGVTISIGIGTDNGDYAQNCEAARIAIEMALARGGDQAVVKECDKMAFYGGKTQRAEKNTRVRARVKAQALRELIASQDRVIVMGHKNTDIDSLGACIGVCRAAIHAGKPAHIVLGEINSSIRPWIQLIRNSGEYPEDLFLTHEQAIELTEQGTVVAVVDTNRPTMTECEEILYLTKTIVVVDHHRQGTEKIENASLSYIEPSASSACEMISEILQYYDDGIKMKSLEADCMYAGIIVDTDNFVAKTGIRTFEAAAFLRRCGADVTRVRKNFREDMDTYKARAETVRHAEKFMNCYAIGVCPSEGLESPTVVGAKAANELLNIVGVKASFVLTEYNNRIFISARAIDEVNVQLIMERMGGGGHLNIAGTQLADTDIETARVRLKEVLTTMTKEGAL